MAMSASSHRPTTFLRALILLSVFAVLVADVEGRHHVVCHPFSCGGLSNVSYPFRRQGDPHGCGVQSHELVCTETSYDPHRQWNIHVLSINYTGSYFWVVDANLNMQNSCPLPPWDYGPYYYHYHDNSLRSINQDPGWPVALFMNCSQEIKYDYYSQPVKCLSTADSFIYMSIWSGVYNFVVEAQYFAPSCSFLAMTPLGGPGATVPENASYPDVVKLMGKGFALEFPFTASRDIIRECLAELKR